MWLKGQTHYDWRVVTEGLGLKCYNWRLETEGKGLQLKGWDWMVATEGLQQTGCNWSVVIEELGLKCCELRLPIEDGWRLRTGIVGLSVCHRKVDTWKAATDGLQLNVCNQNFGLKCCDWKFPIESFQLKSWKWRVRTEWLLPKGCKFKGCNKLVATEGLRVANEGTNRFKLKFCNWRVITERLRLKAKSWD